MSGTTIRKGTKEKIDDRLYKFAFPGEVLSPRKVMKLCGTSYISASRYLEHMVPRSIGKGKFVRRILRPCEDSEPCKWGYAEGYGPTKMIWIGERIENLLDAAETALERGLLEGLEERREGIWMIRYARRRAFAERINPCPNP